MQTINPILSRGAALPRPHAKPATADAKHCVVAGAVIVAAFFGGLGTWAAVAEISGAAIAPAVVKVEANRQAVQHPEGGVVKEILVKEGDLVERSQVLIRLDDTATRATVDELTSQRDALKALQARLMAEHANKDEIVYDKVLSDRAGDPAVKALMSLQQNVFEARRRSLNGQVSVLRQRIAQFNEQIHGMEAQAAANQRQRALIIEELQGTRSLYERGYATKTRVLALQRTQAALEGERNEKLADAAKARQAIGEAEMQILQLEKERLTEVSDQLRDSQSKLFDLVPRLRAATEALVQTELKAPMSGHVVALTAYTVGGVISRGEHVLDIVPTHSPMLLDGQLRPDDINEVKPGMSAEIRLTAYKQRVLPVLHGTVKTVSADRITDQKTGNAFYQLLAEVDQAELDAMPNIRLYSGMSAEIVVPTSPRTVLDYLIAPLTAGIHRALREK